MRRPLVIVALAFAALLAVGGILVARAVLWFGPELEDRDYTADLHAHALAINAVTSEEGAAGWAAYTAVIDAVIAADESLSGEPAWQPDGTLRLRAIVLDSPEHRSEAQLMLDALQQHEASARLDELAAAPPPVRPQATSGAPPVVHEDTKAARLLTRALAIELHDSIIAGAPAEAARTLRHMNALGRALMGQSTLLEHLVGSAIQVKGTGTLRYAVVAAQEAGAAPSAEMVDTFLPIVSADPGPTVVQALEGERLSALAMIAAELPPRQGLQFRAISRGAQASRINEAFDNAIAFARRPAPDRFGETHEQANPGRMDVMPAILMPAFDRFITSGDQIAMQCHATLLMLHIERHIALAGAPPGSFDELNLPPEALRDPWSGRPYGYRRLAEDEYNRPYLLWAVGADGEDSDGARHPDGNDHALGDTETSADWIVNAPAPDE
jgi:hypothetical protein